MNRKSLLGCAVLGLLMGPSFSQEAPPGKREVPGYVLRYSNLSEKDRVAYAELKIKGEQLFRQKRIFEALAKVHEALKIFDEDPTLWNMKGSCHVEFRAFGKARAAFKHALSINDKDMGVLFNLAEIDFVTKEWEDCIDKMTRLNETLLKASGGKMEGSVLHLHDLALFKKILALQKLGKGAEARQLAEDNWEEFDDTPFTYFSKAALAFLDKDDESARAWITSAISVFGGLDKVANWQDTLIEFGYVKSFYGGDDGVIDLSEE